MKKIVLLITLVLVLTLAGCESETETPFEHDVPEEGNIYVHNLDYYEYIDLNNPVVTITVKDIGEIKIQLFEEVAPNTVHNFVKYIEDGAYTSNEFHRVVEGFMIQGGMLEDPSCTIEGQFESNGFENELNHYRGVLSMARTNDKDSASSQFFIMHQNNVGLNGEYAAFGGVVSGFNVLDYIASLQAENTETPTVEIIIESITIDLKDNTYPDPVCID
jgi:peptidyl-prolyl cis-trans isomerase B (cyclophilin B)